MNSRYGSRKFIIALVALGLGTWMRFKGVLSDESTLTLMVTAVLGYQGTNLGVVAFGSKNQSTIKETP